MNSVYTWSFLAFCTTLCGAGLLLSRREWAKANLWRILAFASGVLLSVSFLHILPEAQELSPKLAGVGVLSAFLLIFSIEGVTMAHSCTEFAEECHEHVVGWSAFGALALHSLFDGAAIAVAFGNDQRLGMAVAGAILAHKFTDGLTLTGLLMSAQYSTARCLKTVSLLALATPLGALLAYPFLNQFSAPVMGWGLGFIAGIFFYIGASDILPRLHKAKDIYCLGSFAVGLLLGLFRPL